MKMKLLVAATLALSSMSLAAHADDNDNDGAVTGAAGGAVTGAVVGGPVGAVVGGAVGLAAGAIMDPPDKVVTYVQEQPIPTERIVVQQPIVVGKPVPADVVLTPIPDNSDYSYTVINEQRVIVDPETHTVVKVLQ